MGRGRRVGGGGGQGGCERISEVNEKINKKIRGWGVGVVGRGDREDPVGVGVRVDVNEELKLL